MKRIGIWCAIVAAAFLCAASGLYLHRAVLGYDAVQNDIDRQLGAIDALRLQQSGYAQQPAGTESASGAVGYISEQIAGCCLTEESLLSEMGEPLLDGWEEWRVEAVCTGDIGDLGVFVDSLEANGAYHGMNLTLGQLDEGRYELSLKLSFYARHV